MATDFRDGKTFPRRGREPMGGFLWLARVYDKGRAAKAGTIHDYIYPCPMDKGMFSRWGISVGDFEDALLTCSDDAALLRWAQQRIDAAKRDAANHWLLTEKKPSLDRQDSEEGF